MNAELLRSILDYNPETGVFMWKIDASGKAPAGSEAGTIDEYGYIVIRYEGVGYKAHRLAWLYVNGEWPKTLLDHKDLVKDHNWIDNLREADHSVNQMNIVEPNVTTKSGYRWVSWFDQYKKWKASFMIHGRKYFVGYFDDPKEAHEYAKSARDGLLNNTNS